MNVRFHIEPWDEKTRTTFVEGMAAILAAYLQGNGDDEKPNGEGTALRSINQRRQAEKEKRDE